MKEVYCPEGNHPCCSTTDCIKGHHVCEGDLFAPKRIIGVFHISEYLHVELVNYLCPWSIVHELATFSGMAQSKFKVAFVFEIACYYGVLKSL